MSEPVDPHDPHKPRKRGCNPILGALPGVLLFGFVAFKLWVVFVGKPQLAREHEELRRQMELERAALRSLKLWDARTGAEVGRFAVPAGIVVEAAFSDDGTKLAAAGFDKCVFVWDVSQPQEPATFRGFSGVCMEVAVTRDGKRVAGVDQRGEVRVWDTTNPNDPVAVIPAGAKREPPVLISFLGGVGTRLLVATRAGQVRVWQVGEGDPRQLLAFHRTGPWAFGSGSQIAFAPDAPAAAVEVWDWRTGRRIATILAPDGRSFVKLAFAAGSTRLTALADDGIVRVFDPASGTERFALGDPAEGPGLLATGDDGERLYTAGRGGIESWDPRTGARVGAFALGPGETVSSVSREGPYLVGKRGESGAIVWRVPDNVGIEQGVGDGRRVWEADRPVLFNRDATAAVRGGELIDPGTGAVVGAVAGVDPAKGFFFVAFRPDGRAFVGTPR